MTVSLELVPKWQDVDVMSTFSGDFKYFLFCSFTLGESSDLARLQKIKHMFQIIDLQNACDFDFQYNLPQSFLDISGIRTCTVSVQAELKPRVLPCVKGGWAHPPPM